jgi:hypothetical protein
MEGGPWRVGGQGRGTEAGAKSSTDPILPSYGIRAAKVQVLLASVAVVGGGGRWHLKGGDRGGTKIQHGPNLALGRDPRRKGAREHGAEAAGIPVAGAEGALHGPSHAALLLDVLRHPRYVAGEPLQLRARYHLPQPRGGCGQDARPA